MERTWKPVDAGTLDIIGGIIIILAGIMSPFVAWNIVGATGPDAKNALILAILLGIILLCLGAFAIYGGEMALKRCRWGLAIGASICASLVLLGIPSFVLTILSRKEFSNKKSHKTG